MLEMFKSKPKKSDSYWKVIDGVSVNIGYVRESGKAGYVFTFKGQRYSDVEYFDDKECPECGCDCGMNGDVDISPKSIRKIYKDLEYMAREHLKQLKNK